jgi:hypothetical protein
MEELIESVTASADTTGKFWKIFNDNTYILKTHIASINRTNCDVKTSLAHCKQRISQLQTYATESTKVLPAYDVRRSQEVF